MNDRTDLGNYEESLKGIMRIGGIPYKWDRNKNNYKDNQNNILKIEGYPIIHQKWEWTPYDQQK